MKAKVSFRESSFVCKDTHSIVSDSILISPSQTEELEREEAKPKKKLRAPGGLLTDVEEGEGSVPPSQLVNI